MVRSRRRQAEGDLVGALSTLAPVGKGAVLGIARALGNRALKMGSKTATGAALGAAGAGAIHGVRKKSRNERRRRPRKEGFFLYSL